MPRIDVVNEADADARTLGILARARGASGHSWNVIKALTHNPAVLEGYLALSAAKGKPGDK